MRKQDMGNQFSKKTRKKARSIQAQRIFRSRWFKSLVAMGSAVVFFTVYSLTIPAATLTEDQAAADSGIVLEEPATSEPQVVETGEAPAPEEAPKEEPVAQAAVEETPAAASEETAAQTPVEETGTALTAEDAATESSEESAEETREEEEEIGTVSELKAASGNLEALVRFADGAGIPENASLVIYGAGADTGKVQEALWSGSMDSIEQSSITTDLSEYVSFAVKDADGNDITPDSNCSIEISFGSEANLSDPGENRIRKYGSLVVSSDGNVSVTGTDLSTGNGHTYATFTGTLSGNTFGFAVSTAKQKTNFLEGKLSYEGEDYTIEVSVSKNNQIPENSKLNVKELDKDSEEFKKKLDQAAEAVQKDAEKKSSDDIKTSVDDASVRMFDITILNEDGDEIQPNGNVRVSVQYKNAVKVGADAKMKAVHFDEKNDEVQVLTPETKADTSDTEKKVHEVRFNANGFSVYAIVGTETIKVAYLSADGTTYEVTVTYDQAAGIPDGAQLLVSEIKEDDVNYADYVQQTAAMVESDAETLNYFKLLDIRIVDGNGEKVVLNAPVDVQIRLLDNDSMDDTVQIVHFAENAETEEVKPELLEKTSSPENNTVSFQTNGFSAYAIVQGPAAIKPGWERVSSLADLTALASGGLYIGTTGNYYLTNRTTKHVNGTSSIEGLSGIERSSSTRADYPTDDAAQYYFEPVPGTTNQFYLYCYGDDSNKLYATYDTTATGVPYSIILTSDESLKTPCTLSVSGSGSRAYWRIRFNNDGNLRWNLRNNIIDAHNADTNFYIWHEAGTDQDTYDLDGKTYGLMYWIEGIKGKALMAEENAEAGHLDALALTVMSKPNNGAKLYVPDDSEISFWTFHFIDTDFYYLTTIADGSTKYLQISSSGLSLVSTPDDNCKIRVIPGSGSNDGKISLKVGNRTLAYSGDIDSGFRVGGSAGSEWLNLVEESELTSQYFMTYSAAKVSVSDESVTNGSRVIVYTCVWNDDTKKYEFYAVDHDGSLVRCYESGDNIKWVSGRLNSMLWSFAEYYWEGTTDPNYYYDLYNQYSEKYLAPQKSNDQILSDEAIGINLNGRRNGQYYSPIVAWDDGYYAYVGLKADKESGKIVSCPLEEADDFYFAIVQDIPVDDALTIVPTVDHTQYGITMKMINFGTDLYQGNNDTNVRAQMRNFLGSNDKYTQWGTEAGILNTSLGENGYPVTKTGNSLADWFANAQEVNHLFVQSTYTGTGYYEYDSVQNFAHLDQTTNNFVVYKQLGSDSATGATHKHGLFWPYNDIKAGIFSVNKNTTNISAQNLPETDPRKYETMYQVQKANTNFAPDYYFGMEVTASFTQTPNGLDAWGHDIIYEFTGDDDFWLFVDGELIIDLGGIHSALPGSVNYRTGVVNVNGTITSLRALFEENYRSRNESATNEEVKTYLDKIFDGEIFKPYTTHTMKIYYLERGAGSSNLHMRFNLASIKPGTVQLTKRLSGVETTETVLAEFPYQIIYRTKTGDTISDPIYLTNYAPNDPSRTNNYVFYKDTTVACAYKPSYVIAGKTYKDVFILKPDETVDINFPAETFPEGTELYDYKIIECGVNTDVYKGVKVNDTEIEGTYVTDDQGTALTNRKDYDIDYATTDQRARVVYDNAVNENAITNLTITKKLFDVTGETEITEVADKTVFDFRLYLATESGEIDSSPVNMHTYHVKADNGNYCVWSVADRRLVPLEGEGKTVFANLSPEEQSAATFHTSMNGSITYIPVGYTVEVRDLLAGTKFKVVERPSEIPDGYSFWKYLYKGVPSAVAMAGVADTIEAGSTPKVEVHNFKGFGLRVNKIWTDADYMSERDAAYFGIFYQDSSNEWKLVPDSLRQMAYGTTTIYWYYDALPVPGITDFSKYAIYEVSLTKPVVDDDGKVTSYSTLIRLEEGASLTLSGKQIGDTTASPFTYTVAYKRGEKSSNSNVRVDEVTNSRPGIVLKKTDWSGTALPGATFTLVDADGNNIGTYTSGSDGLITEVYLRNNVNYTLTETSAPQGWHGLETAMTIRLDQNGAVSITGSDAAYYAVSTDIETNKTTITVKNRPYTLKVIKMDKETNAPLKNVTFKLYREIVVDGVHAWDPNPYPGYESIKSDSNGIVLNGILPAGKYQLRETTPSGYLPLSGHVTFTVSGTGVVEASGTQPGEAVYAGSFTQEDGSILYQITITNAKYYVVSVWKTDEAYNTITSGASFSLYKAEDYYDDTRTIRDGAVPVTSGTTAANGILALGNLAVGEYRLIETKAPDGYNLATSAIKIYVTNNGVTAMQGVSESLISTNNGRNTTDKDHWVSGQNNNTWQIRVWNNSGIELPSTGGSGTLPYTLGGIALIVASTLMYGFRLRRRERRSR